MEISGFDGSQSRNVRKCHASNFFDFFHGSFAGHASNFFDLFRILSQDDLIFWISCSFTVVLQAHDDLAKEGLDQALHFQKRGV